MSLKLWGVDLTADYQLNFLLFGLKLPLQAIRLNSISACNERILEVVIEKT